MADSPTSSGDDPDWTLVDQEAAEVESLSSVSSEPSLVDVPRENPETAPAMQIIDKQPAAGDESRDSDSDLVPLNEESDDHLDGWVAPEIPNRRCSQSQLNIDESSECTTGDSEDDDELSSLSDEDVLDELGDAEENVVLARNESSDLLVEELPADYPASAARRARVYVHSPNSNVNDWLTTVLLVVLAVVVGVAIGHFHGSERSSWVSQHAFRPVEVVEPTRKVEAPDLRLTNVIQQLLTKHTQLENKIVDLDNHAKDSLKELRNRVVSLDEENRDLRMRLLESRKKCTRILHKWPAVPEMLRNLQTPAPLPTANFTPLPSVVRPAVIQPLPEIFRINPAKVVEKVRSPLEKKNVSEPGFFVDENDYVRLLEAPKEEEENLTSVDFVMIEDVIVPNRSDKLTKKKAEQSAYRVNLRGMVLKSIRKMNGSEKIAKKASEKRKPSVEVLKAEIVKVSEIKKDIREEKAKVEKAKVKKAEFGKWKNSSDNSVPKKEKKTKKRDKAVKIDKKKSADGHCFVDENKCRRDHGKFERKKDRQPGFWNTLPPFIRSHFTKTAKLERILKGFGTDVVASKVFRRVVEEVPRKLKMSTEFWNCQWNWWNNFARSSSVSSYGDCAGYLTSWQYKYREGQQQSADNVKTCSPPDNTNNEDDYSNKDWFRGKFRRQENFDMSDEDWSLRRASARAHLRSASTVEHIQSLRNSTWWFFGRARDRETLRKSSRYSDPFVRIPRQKKFAAFPQDPIYEFLKQRTSWQAYP